MIRLEPEHRLTDEEFRLLRDLIRAHCGIWFTEDSRHLVERRLSPRIESLGLAGFTEYYLHIRYADDRRGEMEEIVERITTNETYFFREQYQLDAFQQEILPELHTARRANKRLHVWSAGCSTGEEAYTIAMLILETGLFGGWDVRIFGNDVSRRVLSVARKGVYGRSSFRSTQPRYVRDYFRPVPPDPAHPARPGDGRFGADGKYQVRDELRGLVSFGLVNLLEEDMLGMIGEMDVIFCRNVLIYFDTEARRRVVQTFAKKLTKRGYLLLGHTESLINLSTAFELVHLERDMVYRKP